MAFPFIATGWNIWGIWAQFYHKSFVLKIIRIVKAITFFIIINVCFKRSHDIVLSTKRCAQETVERPKWCVSEHSKNTFRDCQILITRSLDWALSAIRSSTNKAGPFGCRNARALEHHFQPFELPVFKATNLFKFQIHNALLNITGITWSFNKS